MLLVLLVACKPEPQPSTPGSWGPYELDHLLEVDIALDPADWQALRTSANDPLEALGGDCMAGPPESAFDWFTGTVTLDGETLADVALRKKGFFGSTSAAKPSMKLDFDKNVDAREWNTVEKLTLNNNVQDDSQIRTCLAYSIFADAGVPAPRCSFAHVTVNGEDLGIYTNVEPYGKRFLRDHFEDDGGNLYEGQVADFREGFVDRFEYEGDAEDPDRSDLDTVVAALASPDDTLEDAVGGVVDLDAFYPFWATETLVAHWDGYANDFNNFYAYHDPTSGLFQLLPWGPDYSFHTEDIFMPAGRPPSVSANGYIASRLYSVETGRQRYVATLEQLLAEVWDEDALLARIDRMEAVIEPAADPLGGRWQESLDDVRTYVTDRRATIEADIAGGPADWPYDLPEAECSELGGTITATFSTTWNTNQYDNPFNTGTGSIEETLEGGFSGASVVAGASIGDDGSDGFGYRYAVQILGSFPDGSLRLVYLLIAPSAFTPGADIVFDWQSAFGTVGEVNAETGDFARDGSLYSGTLHLDEASTTDGGAVSGTLTAEILVDVPAE